MTALTPAQIATLRRIKQHDEWWVISRQPDLRQLIRQEYLQVVETGVRYKRIGLTDAGRAALAAAEEVS